MAKNSCPSGSSLCHLLTLWFQPALLLAGLANPDGLNVLAVSKVAALCLKMVNFSALRPENSFLCFVAGLLTVLTFSLLTAAFKSTRCHHQASHKKHKGCDDCCKLQHQEVFCSEELFQALLNRHLIVVGHCHCKLFPRHKLWCSDYQQLFSNCWMPWLVDQRFTFSCRCRLCPSPRSLASC